MSTDTRESFPDLSDEEVQALEEGRQEANQALLDNLGLALGWSRRIEA
jgi:hypothetical protein